MQRPVAFKVLPEGDAKIYRVRAEPLDVSSLRIAGAAPAVVVSRSATMLTDLTTGIVDVADIVAVTNGDWANAILIVVNDDRQKEDELMQNAPTVVVSGDEDFFQSVHEIAPSLTGLSRRTVDLIRSAGVDGQLVKKAKGRWVNSPVNSFTLKVQPRKLNLQFTLYGNPSSYEHNGFLRQDQNSYSRGWVENEDDANTLAALVAKSHARRTR